MTASTQSPLMLKVYHRKELLSISEKKLTPKEKYDKNNTQFIGLKLNKKSDADILNAVEGKPKQTEIKRLIRLGLQNEKKE